MTSFLYVQHTLSFHRAHAIYLVVYIQYKQLNLHYYALSHICICAGAGDVSTRLPLFFSCVTI